MWQFALPMAMAVGTWRPLDCHGIFEQHNAATGAVPAGIQAPQQRPLPNAIGTIDNAGIVGIVGGWHPQCSSNLAQTVCVHLKFNNFK